MSIDKIIDLLLQGIVSGLVILFATWWIQKYKEAKLSQKYAILADIELKTHYDALLSIINKYSSDYDSDLASTFGMLALPYLTEMPKENLQFATLKDNELPDNRHQHILKDELIELKNEPSAIIICCPPILNEGKSAITRTIIPIPPIQ